MDVDQGETNWQGRIGAKSPQKASNSGKMAGEIQMECVLHISDPVDCKKERLSSQSDLAHAPTLMSYGSWTICGARYDIPSLPITYPIQPDIDSLGIVTQQVDTEIEVPIS